MDRNFFLFDLLEPSAQRRIYEDEEWTWAAFVREPAERLLSAFLDKLKTKKDLTFERFVDSLRPVNGTNCGGIASQHKRSKGRKKELAEITGEVTGLGWCSDPRKLVCYICYIALVGSRFNQCRCSAYRRLAPPGLFLWDIRKVRPL